MHPLNADTVAALADGAPDWMVARREAGLELFDKLAMPTSKEEVWRYVDLDFDLADLGLAPEPGDPMPADAVTTMAGGEAGRMTIVDGHVASVHSAAPAGVVFGPVAAAAHLPRLGVPADLDKLAAAAHAFGGDGAALYVPDGSVVEGSFLVDVQATVPGSVSFPRITVVLGADAEASLVVALRSPAEGDFYAVPHIEAQVGDGSRLRMSTIQEWGYSTRAIAQQRVVMGRNATVRLGEAGLGGRLARLHFFADLAGPGADLTIDGLYFGEDEQLLDYRGFITHQAPNTTSNMYLKGAVEDESHSVFTGLIRIEEEAQKTNAFQTNRNLVLSDGAGAESVPNLEILANDVQCGHGSTVGPLDEEQRYYLMSRGLDRLASDRLQVRGFFQEALDRFPHPDLADELGRIVNAKYVSAQAEGRV